MHSGSLASHFARSVYNSLSKIYWWERMHSDVHCYCHKCLTRAAYGGTGQTHKLPSKSIPVSAPLRELLLTSCKCHKQRMGINTWLYLWTIWPSGSRPLVSLVWYYRISDKWNHHAQLLVDHIVCRHGVPVELLLDWGPNLLSNFTQDVCSLLGMHKINMTAYHPQCDGLVWSFNWARTAVHVGQACQRIWTGLGFASATASLCISSQAKLFFKRIPLLSYGRDPWIPTESAFSMSTSTYQVDLEDYRTDLTKGLTAVWRLAQQKYH